mmetsp:Transcript_3340/g.4842  ORF Transcript_3340/g.4842 Transcript_3340/m.4842 type:complete len:437 (+) Transcript_3340:182-1492(+)
MSNKDDQGSAGSNTLAGLFARQMVAGGGAGAISRTLTAPMERVKVLLQVQIVSKVPVEQQYKGIIDCLVRIPKEQGITGYWRGNGVNVLRMIPNSAIKFTTFDYYKKLAFPNGEQSYEGTEKFFRKMVCGGVSGVSTIVPVYPLDLARTRLSADTTRRYNGLGDVLKSTVSRDGYKGLYNGLGVSLCGIIPYLAISLSTYDTLKDMTKDDSRFQHPLGKVMLGSIAAICSQSIAYPIDTVRRHMQVSGGLGQKKLYSGSLDCIIKIWNKTGVRGFYRGLLANATRAAPQTGIEFACYDVIASLITKQQPKNEQFAQIKTRLPRSLSKESHEEEEDVEEDSAKNRLVRRLSATLPDTETVRINRIFSALTKQVNSQNNTISHDDLKQALMELGYEEFEIDEVLAPASEVKMIGFMEFRQLCQDNKVHHLLEQQFDDM